MNPSSVHHLTTGNKLWSHRDGNPLCRCEKVSMFQKLSILYELSRTHWWTESALVTYCCFPACVDSFLFFFLSPFVFSLVLSFLVSSSLSLLFHLSVIPHYAPLFSSPPFFFFTSPPVFFSSFSFLLYLLFKLLPSSPPFCFIVSLFILLSSSPFVFLFLCPFFVWSFLLFFYLFIIFPLFLPFTFSRCSLFITCFLLLFVLSFLFCLPSSPPLSLFPFLSSVVPLWWWWWWCSWFVL